MKSLVRFSLGQAVFLNVVFIILMVGGLFSLFTSPVENLPLVDVGKVFIHTPYYGASADDVERLVTREIEDSLDDMENVEYVQSKSYRNFSSVEVKFIDDTDYKDLFDELRFRTLSVQKQLPQGADEPVFVYLDTNLWKPVVVVNLVGDMPQHSLKLLAEELKNQLLSIPGVRNAQILGEFEKEFHVNLDPNKMRRHGVTFHQVVGAIRSAATKIPTGRFRTGDEEFMLDTGQAMERQQQVLDVVVRREGDGHFIRVADLVTHARLDHRDPITVPSVNGVDTLQLVVTKELGGNSLDISRLVKETAENFEKSHAREGIRVVFNKDSVIEINDSIKTLGGNLLLGMSLVTLVLWVSMGLRNAMLTAIGVPFSFLATFVIMRATGVSLNTITLFSFVLVTGIMVDDAVVIVENVFRHMQMGKKRLAAIVDGTSEVMLPVVASALTTVFAFLPMLIMSGSTGDFFSYVPITVSFALAASLLEALFILPVHIMDWGPKKLKQDTADEEKDAFHHLQKGLFSPIWKVYQAVLGLALRFKLATLCGVFVLFALSLFILIASITGYKPFIKVQFFPGNYFRYHVTVRLPAGTSLEKTDEVVRDISEYIMSMGPQVAESAEGMAGFLENEDYTRETTHYNGQIVVTLPEEKIRAFPDNPRNDPMIHLEYMRGKILAYVDEKYTGEKKPRVRVFEEGDGPPSGKAVNLRVTALTMDDALAASDSLMHFIQEDPELSQLRDLEDNRPDMTRTIRFLTREEKTSEYNLQPGDVTALVAGALNGYPAGRFRALDEEVDLMVRMARAEDEKNPTGSGLAHPLEVMETPMVEHHASPVLLSDLVRVEHVYEPNVRARYKGRPTITIEADIAGTSKLSPARVKTRVEEFFEGRKTAFPGVSLSWGGEFESTSRSFTSLALAFIISLMLIYMVLSSQFNSYLQPVIIISAVPFALIGVVMGLFLTGTTFTIGSFMATVGLAGVAVNTSLLLIDFMNKRYKKQGKPLRESIFESCAARMRPVVITTVTTTLGLLPMAIGIPNKSISWSPMATAFVAGLASSTMLALIVVPVEYELFESIKKWFGIKRTRDRLSEEQTGEEK